MSNKKTTKQFYVYAQLDVYTSVVINADSLEDAMAKARTLELSDFADLAGEHIDGTGVTLKGVDEL